MSSRIILPGHGDENIFKFQDVKELTPEANEVVVKTHFSGINFADIVMRQGFYPDAPKYPFTPGYEFSGEIEKVGPGVQNLQAGERVFGGSFFGGYAGRIKVPANQVRKVPEQLSMEEAASIPVSFLTAYITLFDLARVRTGDKILIDCMTGSLGHFCMEILKGMNCEITGLTSSESKLPLIQEMGARGMTHEQFYQLQDKKEKFDFVLNSQGGKSITEHYKRLSPTGRMVMVGASSAVKPGKRSLLKAIKMLMGMPTFKPVNIMNDNKGVMGLNVLRLFEDPHFLFERLDKVSLFDLKINVDKTFSAKEVGLAHRYIEEKKSKGKVLLSWLTS